MNEASKKKKILYHYVFLQVIAEIDEQLVLRVLAYGEKKTKNRLLFTFSRSINYAKTFRTVGTGTAAGMAPDIAARFDTATKYAPIGRVIGYRVLCWAYVGIQIFWNHPRRTIRRRKFSACRVHVGPWTQKVTGGGERKIRKGLRTRMRASINRLEIFRARFIDRDISPGRSAATDHISA